MHEDKCGLSGGRVIAGNSDHGWFHGRDPGRLGLGILEKTYMKQSSRMKAAKEDIAGKAIQIPRDMATLIYPLPTLEVFLSW